ncbi:MAG: ATP-binding cassette domain-containing protein [Acholeplasmataceae bacterium]|nr:ATP-binding cassette domain-containing protein [Acholeplasmataceae bacterium]
MCTYLIEVNHVSKSFNGLEVIRDLSINVESGKVYLLLGENGSGKSTFIKMLVDLYLPTSGIITRHYEDFRYVPELLTIKSEVKVLSYIRAVLNLRGLKRNLEMELDLEIELNKQLRHLSKGNLKKVLIYLALVGAPEILFLDEPLDGLDKNMQTKVINYFQQMPNATFIISTHDTKKYDTLTNIEVINFG